jgi:hypothetical protein
MHQVHSVRLVMLMLLVMLGLGTLSVSPVAAADCATIGPGANLAGCDLSGMGRRRDQVGRSPVS